MIFEDKVWRIAFRGKRFRERFIRNHGKIHTELYPNRRRTNSTILLLHSLDKQSRQTTIDFALNFPGEGRSVVAANIRGLMPKWLGLFDFDLAVVTTEALSYRNGAGWSRIARSIRKAVSGSKKVILLPQDDYTDSAKLESLALATRADAIYTPFTRDLHVLYPKISGNGTRFHELLTGYYDEALRISREKLAKPFVERSIDFGQRVRKLPPQFGEIGIRKYSLAERMHREAIKRGFVSDFSADSNAVLLGEEWYRFLGNTKFTVSCRGGSSLADRYGRIRRRLQLLRNIGVRNDEIAFRYASIGETRAGAFDVISPRLFEAAQMGVCQILLEDDYLGMEPWVHYLPLKSDFSNLDEVFERIADLDYCENVAVSAKSYLIESKKFSFETAIAELLNRELGAPLSGSNSRAHLSDVDEQFLFHFGKEPEFVLNDDSGRMELSFVSSPDQGVSAEAMMKLDSWNRIFRKSPESLFSNWSSLISHQRERK